MGRPGFWDTDGAELFLLIVDWLFGRRQNLLCNRLRPWVIEVSAVP
jgi:hypothetical protein